MFFKQSPMFGLTKFDVGFATPDSGPKSAGFGSVFYAIFMFYAWRQKERKKMRGKVGSDYSIFG
jgi:hypothetical protein